MSTHASSRRASVELMHAAAVLYFEKHATQAEVAARLGVSQATVSRLLSEARRRGMVLTEVLPVPGGQDGLEARVAERLRLRRVHIFPDTAPEVLGAGMGPALSAALVDAALTQGDVVLLSSGKTCYTAARTDLPALPGVTVAPTVGGLLEPQPWYQTNEMTRELAARVSGQPAFLYAPALPSPQLLASLLEDPAIATVVDMWGRARCAILGVGAPPTSGRSLPHFAAEHTSSLVHAVGDICSRFYDAEGQEISFPGSDSMLSTSFEVLRAIPTTIAVAVGRDKVVGLVAGARAQLFTCLVTDVSTAELLIL